MKKAKKISLSLNKKTVSKLDSQHLKGGSGRYCTGAQSCACGGSRVEPGESKKCK